MSFDRLRTRGVCSRRAWFWSRRDRSPPSIGRGEISGRTIVAFEAGCAYRRYLEEWILEAGIVPGNILSVGSYLGILACVAAGTGYAVVPQSVLDTVSPTGDIRCYPLPGKLSPHHDPGRLARRLPLGQFRCSARSPAGAGTPVNVGELEQALSKPQRRPGSLAVDSVTTVLGPLPSLCPGRKAGAVAVFGLMPGRDGSTDFPMLRAFRWIEVWSGPAGV